MKVRNLIEPRTLFAIFPPFVAFILQWAFWSDIQPFAWLLFYPAVFLSAWIGGLIPGLASTFVSGMFVLWFFIPPQFTFGSKTLIQEASISVFFVMGILSSILLERLKKAIKQAEVTNDILSASEENLSVTLNSIGDAVMATDAEGRVKRLNFMAEQLTGWSQAEAFGHPVGDIFHIINQKTREPAPIPVETALTQGAIQSLVNDTVLIARDGSEFPIADSCAPIRNRNGSVIGAVLVFRDVTKEYAAKRALIAAKEQAELANRAKDSFLATMSHEIRTPLTGMLGMLELLSLTKLENEQRSTMNAAWDSGRGLLRIVSDILDWSKIEEGKSELSPRPTSITQLLQEVVNTYSRVASAKSLTLWQHADVRLSSAHIVDPLRLSQVLNNFVSNAIKFTQHGEVELRAELLDQLDNVERVRFSIKDTGIGIAKDNQERLFQRYQQENADTARMYGGTGLGLAICRCLAEMMDGVIEFKSEQGLGSIFSITLALPVTSAPVEELRNLYLEVEQRVVKPLFTGSMNLPLVLAVDDHPTNRNLLARQLKVLGLRVETAENGQVALSLWRGGHFALVISDCHMPDMDGYTLSRAIRKIEAEEARPRTPIIAWTANALEDEAGRCDAAGMDDLLVKPADMTQLRKTLAKWLSISETDGDQVTHSQPDVDSGQSATPIDYSVLNRVVADNTEQIQILQDFQSHIRDDYSKLLERIEQNDHANVEDTAHRMKGSSRIIGAKYLATACEDIEQAARNGNMAGARTAKVELDKAINQLETYFVEAGIRGGD